MRQFSLGIFWLILAVAVAQPAHAYLDPGTGSYVLQVAMAGILGAAFAVKTYWLNLKAFVAGMFRRKQPE